MKKLSLRARAMFDRVFPERQIYHRSGGTVHYISVSPWQQAMLAAGVTAIAGWTGMTTISYVFGSGGSYDIAENGESTARYQRWIQELRANTALSRTLLEERTEDFQRVTAEFEERHQALTVILEALESGKDLDITTLRGDNADLVQPLALKTYRDAQLGGGPFDELTHGVLHACRYHEVFRTILLKHHPLHAHIVLCMTPITEAINVTHIKTVLET